MAQVRVYFNPSQDPKFDEMTSKQPHKERLTRARAKISKTTLLSDGLEHAKPSVSEVPPKNSRPRLKKSPFRILELPVEIRGQIYKDALTYDYMLIRKIKARKVANLLLLNRLVYSEAFPIFYDVNVFQLHIGGLPSDTETQIKNVHYMRQCCLHLEIRYKESKGVRITKLINKFVADIWSGKMECLLIDVWEPAEWPAGTTFLEMFSWLRQIHLAQVVVNQVKKKEVVRYQDRWCQRLERSMMACESFVKDSGEEYIATPQLGTHLVGEELEKAKRQGGWFVEDDDLYALFGKC